MDTFTDALMSPGSWNSMQWLIVGIGLLVLIAAFFFAWRLVKIIRDAGKSTYRPNIGLARTRDASGAAGMKAPEPAGESGTQGSKPSGRGSEQGGGQEESP